MQRYYMRFEFKDSKKNNRLTTGYKCVRNGKDAIERAKLECDSCKNELVRVWITDMTSDNPKHTLIFGSAGKGGAQVSLDRPTRSIVDAYKKTAKKAKSKPTTVPAVIVQKEETPRYFHYDVITSSQYKVAV